MTSPLKPGVEFVRTAAGGVLLDVGGDRYVALGRVSAIIWEALESTHDADAAARRLVAVGVTAEQADALVKSQLQRWSSANLLGQPTVSRLPTALAREASVDGELHTPPLAPPPWPLLAILKLAFAERRYARVLYQAGLAAALVAVQAEVRHVTRSWRVQEFLRAYHIRRRWLRQGQTSRDCLLRSLALVAVLRSHDIACSLCLGFIDRPFVAHAWVESRGLVLNETLDQRHRYRVIGRY